MTALLCPIQDVQGCIPSQLQHRGACLAHQGDTTVVRGMSAFDKLDLRPTLKWCMRALRTASL